jgi:hypothetical protein
VFPVEEKGMSSIFDEFCFYRIFAENIAAAHALHIVIASRLQS